LFEATSNVPFALRCTAELWPAAGTTREGGKAEGCTLADGWTPRVVNCWPSNDRTVPVHSDRNMNMAAFDSISHSCVKTTHSGRAEEAKKER
jgi:hypothetical protein